MTTNKLMTGEQLDELMIVAVRMQRDAEVVRNFPSANFAYAVQVAALELLGTRAVASALSAENAALKSAIQTHSESVHFCELCGKDDPCSTDDVCMALSETPATDAFLAEVRAQGVDVAISELNQLAERSEKEAPIAAEHHCSAAMYLQLFAAQLRQEAAR